MIKKEIYKYLKFTQKIKNVKLKMHYNFWELK